MKIEVNVSDLDLSTVIEPDHYYDGSALTLGDKIADQAARKITGSDDFDQLRQRAAQIREEEIRALVVPAITEAFKQPIQRTNLYGEAAGEPIPLRELVIEEAHTVLKGLTSDHYGRQEPLARRLVRELVQQEMARELAKTIKDEKEKVVAAVRAQAAQIIAESVKRGLGS